MRLFLIVSMAVITVSGCAKKITSSNSTGASNSKTETTDFDHSKIVVGNKIYEAKCGRCHELKKVDNFTADEWVPILHKMAPKARLDSTEKASVMEYVKFNSKRTK